MGARDFRIYKAPPPPPHPSRTDVRHLVRDAVLRFPEFPISRSDVFEVLEKIPAIRNFRIFRIPRFKVIAHVTSKPRFPGPLRPPPASAARTGNPRFPDLIGTPSLIACSPPSTQGDIAISRVVDFRADVFEVLEQIPADRNFRTFRIPRF